MEKTGIRLSGIRVSSVSNLWLKKFMIKNVLSDIGGVGVYGVISITLFFAVFVGMLVWAFSMKKSFAQKMSAFPLNDGEKKSEVKGNLNEQ